MTDRLEDLLRDPRAHGDAPDAAEVRAWGEAALTRWQAEQAAERRAPTAAHPAVERSRRWSWRDLATGLGLVSAAAALAPVVGDLLGRLWLRLESGRESLTNGTWTEALMPDSWATALTEAPPLLLAAIPLVVFLCVPQLRDRISRLLDA